MSNRTCSIGGCCRPHEARGWCNAHYTRWRRHGAPTVQRRAFDLSELDAAWLAGLFEGEGCISFSNERSVTLIINLTDKDVLARVAALTRTTLTPIRQREPHHRDAWTWRVYWRPDVEELLDAMLPWLGERRSEQARRALHRLSEQVYESQR